MALELALSALNHIIDQLIDILPKLIISLLIWYVGKYVLSMVSSLIKKFDIKGTDIDDKAIAMISLFVNSFGRIVLVLIILDYLGIGSSVIASIAQGVTFAVAIALGISFGIALEDDARKVVKQIKRVLSHDSN